MSSHSDLKLTCSLGQKEKKTSTSTFAQTAFRESFGLNLYILRNRLAITQRDAASRCSISRAYYGELENSKRHPPPIKRVIQLGTALGASTQEISSLCKLSRSERLVQRDLPTHRSDLRDLVQRLLQHGPSLHPSLIDDLLRRVTEGVTHCQEVFLQPGINALCRSDINRPRSTTERVTRTPVDPHPEASTAQGERLL